jgi:DNA-binding response OmpR family regulator
VEARPKILIVDSSKIIRTVLSQHLNNYGRDDAAGGGYEVMCAETVLQAVDLVRTIDFSLLLIEVHLPGVSGLDFLLWLKKHKPLVHVIMMSPSMSEELKSFTLEHNALYFVKSNNYNTLLEIIALKIHKRGFDVNIRDVSLFDLAQICILSGRPRCMSLSDPIEQQDGVIHFNQSKIIHAAIDEQEGEDALLRIMRMPKGAFQEILPWAPPEEQTIFMPFDALIMGIASVIDEQDRERHVSQNHVMLERLPRLLIVDDDPLTLRMLSDYFLEQGFQVKALRSAREGVSWMQDNQCELVIADVYMADMTGLDFLEWIHHRGLSAKVILMTSLISEHIVRFAAQYGAIKVFRKPMILGELDSFIRYVFSQRFFSGKIRNINLLDLLQVISFGKGHKLYHVRDLAFNQRGLLHLREGNLVHAQYAKLEGEDAFFEIMRIQRGLLNELAYEYSPQQTIDLSLTRLIMRTLARLDQSGTLDFSTHSFGIENFFLEVSVSRIEEHIASQKKFNELVIGERLGEFAGIIAGETSKDEALRLLRYYKKEPSVLRSDVHTLVYSDFGLTIQMDAQNRVEEMSFDHTFCGRTSRGVRIGDDIHKAVLIYGKPRFSDQSFAVWNRISFFCASGVITSISLGAI